MARLFSGEYRHSLDSKARVIIPAKFRSILGEQFKIGPSLDECLTVYTNEGFDEFYTILKSLPSLNPDARKLVRYFIGGTYDVETDSQGRIILPQKLRESVGIQKDVVFVGTGTSAELWSAEKFDGEAASDSREEINQIAAKIMQESNINIPFP